jgi:oxygen-independent coproporphyrinogen-3 oxidase
VAAKDLGFEYMLNGLRLVEGISVAAFTERTGRPVEDLLSRITQAQARGLLTTVDGYWRATPRGFDFLNELQAMFLPA